LAAIVKKKIKKEKTWGVGGKEDFFAAFDLNKIYCNIGRGKLNGR
jgi:hypothetical protein